MSNNKKKTTNSNDHYYHQHCYHYYCQLLLIHNIPYQMQYTIITLAIPYIINYDMYINCDNVTII